MHAGIPAPAVVRVVAREDVHERIDAHVVDVARAGGVHLEAGAIGADANDAAAVVTELHAVGADGLHEAVVTHRDVDPAVDAEGDAIGTVVGAAEVEVSGADALHQFNRAIGDAVAIVVEVGGEVGRVEDVEHLAVPDHAARAVHVGKDGVAVGAAVVIVVHQADDASATLHEVLREVGVGPHEHDAVDRGSHADRVLGERWLGEERDGEAGGRLHFGADFLLVRGVARHGARGRQLGGHRRRFAGARGLGVQ